VIDAADRLIDDGINTYAYDGNGALNARVPKNGDPAYSFNNAWALFNVSSYVPFQIFGPTSYAFNYDLFDRLFATNVSPARFYDGQDLVLDTPLRPAIHPLCPRAGGRSAARHGGLS
jgi:hypothetical protein